MELLHGTCRKNAGNMKTLICNYCKKEFLRRQKQIYCSYSWQNNKKSGAFAKNYPWKDDVRLEKQAHKAIKRLAKYWGDLWW